MMPWEDGTLKYDLHRHFSGSINVQTITKLLNKQGINVSSEEVYKKVVCNNQEPSFMSFLSRFDIFNEIKWTEEAIIESIEQVVRDQATDNIDYSEISFSIDKYINNGSKWTRPEVIIFISDIFNSMCSRYHTDINLILSLKMESPNDNQRINAALINRSDIADRLGGLDIVGNESQYKTQLYRPIFRDWRAANKLVLAHVGETRGVENVFDAIVELHAHRIRHGIAAVYCQETLAAARDLNVCFDVSLHSNLLAGTVPGLTNHHLPKLISAGCNITLGTDDPIVFNCNLGDEYDLAKKHKLLGDSEDEINKNIKMLRDNSIKFAGCHLELQ